MGNETPILMVSALSSETDRILAFENGVDDFVAHPFFARELASRVRAVLRRTSRFVPTTTKHEGGQYGPLRIDNQRAEVAVDGTRVRLTLREFEVLQTLVEREGRVVAREDLMAGAAGDNPASLRVVDTHVKSLRRKLGRVRHCIETVRGVGYRFSGGELRGD